VILIRGNSALGAAEIVARPARRTASPAGGIPFRQVIRCASRSNNNGRAADVPTSDAAASDTPAAAPPTVRSPRGSATPGRPRTSLTARNRGPPRVWAV